MGWEATSNLDARAVSRSTSHIRPEWTSDSRFLRCGRWEASPSQFRATSGSAKRAARSGRKPNQMSHARMPPARPPSVSSLTDDLYLRVSHRQGGWPVPSCAIDTHRPSSAATSTIIAPMTVTAVWRCWEANKSAHSHSEIQLTVPRRSSAWVDKPHRHGHYICANLALTYALRLPSSETAAYREMASEC